MCVFQRDIKKERELVRERKTAKECECVNTFQREVKKSKRERE